MATDVVTDITDDLLVGLTDQASALVRYKIRCLEKHDYLGNELTLTLTTALHLWHGKLKLSRRRRV